MIGEENTGGGAGYVILQPYRGTLVQDFKTVPTHNPWNMTIHQRQAVNPKNNTTSTKYYFSFKNVTGVIAGLEVVNSYNSAADKVLKFYLVCSGDVKVLMSLDLTNNSGTKFSSYGEAVAKKLPYLWEAVANKIPVKFTPYDFLDKEQKRQIGMSISYVNFQGQEVKIQQYWKKETIPAQYNAVERLNPMSGKSEWDYSAQVYFIYESTKQTISDWRSKGWIEQEKRPAQSPEQGQQYQNPQQGYQQPPAQNYQSPGPQPYAPMPQNYQPPAQNYQTPGPQPQSPGPQPPAQNYQAPAPQVQTPGPQPQVQAPAQNYQAPGPQPHAPMPQPPVQNHQAPAPQVQSPGPQPQVHGPAPVQNHQTPMPQSPPPPMPQNGYNTVPEDLPF